MKALVIGGPRDGEVLDVRDPALVIPERAHQKDQRWEPVAYPLTRVNLFGWHMVVAIHPSLGDADHPGPLLTARILDAIVRPEVVAVLEPGRAVAVGLGGPT